MNKPFLYTLSLIIFALVFSNSNKALSQVSNTFYIGAFAPQFVVKDITGERFRNTNNQNQIILLNFYRDIACPVSIHYFYAIEQEKEFLEKHGIQVLAVFQSDVDKINRFKDTFTFFQKMIADPTGQLFEQFQVEQNAAKCKTGFLTSAHKKAYSGSQRIDERVKVDKNSNYLPAQFIISPEGNFKRIHYGKRLGDNIPIQKLKSWIEKNPQQ